MNSSSQRQANVGFFSFVGPDYSRSSTLLNFKSQDIQKIYNHVPAKFIKSVRWIVKNRNKFGNMDLLVVMSPCHMLTPILKVLTKKPVILDAGWSLTDGLISRGFKVKNLFKFPVIYAVDFLSLHSADIVLVESMLQSYRLQKYFALSSKKTKKSYTGLDESQFEKAKEIKSLESGLILDIKRKILKDSNGLIVLFRGKVNREAGFRNICEAAMKLSKKATFIFIIGEKDCLPSELNNVIRLSNVSPGDMFEIYRMAHVAIGQISEHPRLKYTIPHKAYEAGYFKKAYVTSRSNGIKEIYSDTSVFCLDETNSEALALAILALSDREKRAKLEFEIGQQYQQVISQEAINNEFAKLVWEILD